MNNQIQCANCYCTLYFTGNGASGVTGVTGELCQSCQSTLQSEQDILDDDE
jgi:Zn-finger protein